MQIEQRVGTICLLTLTTIAVSAALHWLRPVMIPLVLAVFLAIALSPVVEAQVRYFKAPRGLAIVATLLSAFLFLNLIGGFLSVSVRQLVTQIPIYQTQLGRLMHEATASVAFEWLGLDAEAATAPLSKMVTDNLGVVLLGTTNALLSMLSQGLLVMVFLFFLLLGGGTPGVTGSVVTEVEASIRRYLVLKTLISAVAGTIVWVVLAVLGVDLAFVFGFFAFLLHYVPSIGAVIATLLPLPVVLVSPDVSPAAAVMAILVPGIAQFIIGNFIDPKLLGDSLDLHPITVLLSLMIWGTLWGTVGMLLAVPLTASIKMLLERAELVSPVAEVLAGRLDGFRRHRV
jgi:AI-2 transport protein TqsA